MTDLIPEGESIVLDTSAVIAYLSGSEDASEAARVVIEDLLAVERNQGWISSVTVAETLVMPIRERGAPFEAAKIFLLDFPGLNVRAADFLVAAEAADIRAQTGATLPDAIVAATATVTSSPWLVTNDRRFRDQLAGLEWTTTVMLLSELAR